MKLGRFYIGEIGEAEGNIFVVFAGIGIYDRSSGRHRIFGYGCTLMDYTRIAQAMMPYPGIAYPITVNRLVDDVNRQ